MSTINVDNIAEYTSSGKINATHDIKMASGKKVLNSDGHEVGAMVLLGSETLSSTSAVDFFTATTGWTSSLYSSMRIVCNTIKMSGDGNRLYLKFYGGSTIRTGTLEQGGYQARVDASGSGYYGGSDYTDLYEPIPLGIGNDGREGATLEVDVYPSNGTTSTTILSRGVSESTSGQVWYQTMGGHYDSTASIDGVRVYASSGSFSSGTIHFYGITK